VIEELLGENLIKGKYRISPCTIESKSAFEIKFGERERDKCHLVGQKKSERG